MSLAIHLFITEKFSEESYRRFLNQAQNLYGKWSVEESGPFNKDPGCLTIHECWIKSGDAPPEEWFRVNIEACRHLKDVFMWQFDYEWHLRLETSAGRSPLGLAVEFGGWLLAMHSFRFNLALDRDSSLQNEPTEFRSVEAAAEHAWRFLKEKPPEWRDDLKRRGIVSSDGRLVLP